MFGLEPLWQWTLGGVGTVLSGVGGLVYRNRRRSIKNRRQLEGDPEDPNTEGVLEIAHDTRDKVETLEEHMNREHREVMEKLESMGDD